MVLNKGSLDSKSSALTIRPLLHKPHSYLVLLFVLGYLCYNIEAIFSCTVTHMQQYISTWPSLSISVSKHIINNLDSVGSCFPFSIPYHLLMILSCHLCLTKVLPLTIRMMAHETNGYQMFPSLDQALMKHHQQDFLCLRHSATDQLYFI